MVADAATITNASTTERGLKMAFNGSGTYVRPAGQPVVAGTDILDTTFNTLTADLATALTTCVTRDGQSPLTANIPAGGYKLTNLAAGTTAGDSVRYEQFASPPAIGGTAPAAGAFTTLTATTLTASGTASATQYTSTIATGTAPLVVASTTLVANLHAATADLAATATDTASKTGTGSVYVTNTSPTLVTPLLGTPTSGVLTNCTGLPIAGGGTGQTTALAAIVALAGTQSLAAAGYIHIGSCLIQWGNQTSAGSAATVTYPIAFPTAALTVSLTGNVAGNGYANLNGAGLGLTAFSVITSQVTMNFFWIAIGY